MNTLQLSKSEVAAVADYIFQHSRSSPEGKAFKVWLRMVEFLAGEAELPLFDRKAVSESE